MGTIAKALQKHKAEREGLSETRPEPGPPHPAQANSAKPPAGLVTGAEKALGPAAPNAPAVHVEPAPGGAALREHAADPAAETRKEPDARPLAGSKKDTERPPSAIVAAGKPLPQKEQPPSGPISAEAAEAGLPPASDVSPPAAAAPAGPSAAKAGEAPPAPPAAAVRKVDPSLVSLSDPDGFEADLFRLLRTRILFPQTGRPPRTILVTSALAEEGKSFIAANLAINMARHVDQHVLLVDCDLRKPTIHTKFGLNEAKGLSEYLTHGLDLPSLLLKSGVEKLTILPSGRPPQNPSELITSARMAALIQELRARYHDRYIILDSPPPMMAPETSAIAKWVDGILLVVKYGATPMDMVEELLTHLDREKIIGTVINQFSVREFRRYSYNKYYRYSYKKYSKDGRRLSV